MLRHADKLVVVGCPHYGELNANTAAAILSLGEQSVRSRIVMSGMSLLAYNFNTLWCTALNARRTHGATHFAMIHADIVPFGNWLVDLLDILEEQQADLVSAAVAIKDGQGLTSTALDMGTPADPWRRRRLTMHELMELPETFDARDLAALYDVQVGEFGRPPALLFNTGLWVADLRAPWVEHVCFTINDRIDRGEDGLFRAVVEPEDWNFAKQVHERGGRAVVTRRVLVHHSGGLNYTNAAAWGSCRVDPCWRDEPAPAETAGLLVEA